MNAGIDTLYVYTPGQYVDVMELAAARANGRNPSKILEITGQKTFSVPLHFEDHITMAANAAMELIKKSGIDVSEIERIVLATESAQDFSKTGASYLHQMLGFKWDVEVYEYKHACVSGTYALLDAVNAVNAGVLKKAMVVMSDICRYMKGTTAEFTQGAGAVALVVAKNPRLVEIETAVTGTYSRNVSDFYRPSDSEFATVNGHFSLDCYIHALLNAFHNHVAKIVYPAKKILASFARLAFHVPFPKLVETSYKVLSSEIGFSDGEALEMFVRQLLPSLSAVQYIGNSYTASLYVALASTLIYAQDKERIGLYSYGSGCSGKFLSGRIISGAGRFMTEMNPFRDLHERRKLSIKEYETLFYEKKPIDAAYNGCYLTRIENGYRYYDWMS